MYVVPKSHANAKVCSLLGRAAPFLDQLVRDAGSLGEKRSLILAIAESLECRLELLDLAGNTTRPAA